MKRLITILEWLVLLPLWRRAIKDPRWRIGAAVGTGLAWLILVVIIASAAGGDDADEPESLAVAGSPQTPTVEPTPTVAPTPTPTPAPDPRVEAVVLRVIDGDTIEVSLGGQPFTLRYIGIDTPETKDPNSPVECFGAEATTANEVLVAGQTVLLEKDVSETDRFGRLLRYVWIGDQLVNLQLVSDGYAVSSPYPPDVKHQDKFDAAELVARQSGSGLWGACGGADVPLVDEPEPVPPAAGAGGCDTSYPTVCIPPPPPDLDCGEITPRRFDVVPPDPHGFDGDNDGVGCES